MRDTAEPMALVDAAAADGFDIPSGGASAATATHPAVMAASAARPLPPSPRTAASTRTAAHASAAASPAISTAAAATRALAGAAPMAAATTPYASPSCRQSRGTKWMPSAAS